MQVAPPAATRFETEGWPVVAFVGRITGDAHPATTASVRGPVVGAELLARFQWSSWDKHVEPGLLESGRGSGGTPRADIAALGAGEHLRLDSRRSTILGLDEQCQ